LRNAHFGFIFQSYNLLEDLTALENVLLPARIGGRRVDARFGVELLARVGLDQRAHFPARALSGGERQRVAIARALCNAPSLIFADEPTGNLDRENSGLVSDLLFSLVREAGASLLLVTHDLELASRCDRQWRLEAGAIGIPNVTQQLVLDRSESSRG
jgi:predicted ABC-type transport system involved in lysophospholipase L1 biosynthesis ATPase subunit